MKNFSSIIMGDGSLLIQCAERLLARENTIACVVTGNDKIADWARVRGIAVQPHGADLADRLPAADVDWLLSIANLSLIPDAVLQKAKSGAINFHDGPLPRYAGLNAPLWALMAREPQHGISWHMIEGGVDEGDIIEQRLFDLSENETALSLNAACYAAAMESFDSVLDQLESGDLKRVKQDLSQRNYCAGTDRPAAAARIDFNREAGDILALIRALNHGDYRNPLACPKIEVNGEILLVSMAQPASAVPGAAPGTVLGLGKNTVTVACQNGAVTLLGLRDFAGHAASAKVQEGDVLPSLSAEQAQKLTAEMADCMKYERHWLRKLAAMNGLEVPLLGPKKQTAAYVSRQLPGEVDLATVALFIARLLGQERVDLAYAKAEHPYLSNWVPLPIAAGSEPISEAHHAAQQAIEHAGSTPGFARDLILRDPGLTVQIPAIGLGETGAALAGTGLTFDHSDGLRLFYDSTRISEKSVDLLIARLQLFASAMAGGQGALADLPILPDAERALVIEGWNDTQIAYDPACVHQQFQAQVQRSPDKIAVVFEGQSLTYAQLNARANQVAHVLVEMGVKPDMLVGLYMDRSLELLIGALAIQKAGGAYVPLDPGYPKDRIAHYISDSRAPVIVTRASLADQLPAHQAEVLKIDSDPRIDAAADDNPESGVGSANLAYMIYTSGSTGVPKGVMIEHRNVANFFAGMDQRITYGEDAVWLAVTSLSFDISVLELFYTLARGFKLVVSDDESRTLASSGRLQTTDRGMDFSIFFWGNDDGPGPKKYQMLLDGARFADQNGFCAVWTPERHFHAFGGPYPNPSLTGAAVAAVTKNIGVRSGSCVAPLHHPARIAEEWAVIDNLTNGRAGLGIAAGWQPDDFVLRPENTPPNNKQAMYDAIDKLRKLWVGEAVAFPRQDGGMHEVVTQPRPVSKRLPIWVTIAGNPQTWVEAGEIGANVLTHLLGQSIQEVEGKIKLYHDALRKAGHDPKDFTVTLMLHTYVNEDRETARKIARGPMKEYLRSAAGLIKKSAWDFPAFKRPKGVENSFELNLDLVEPQELEAILDFAFERYFEDSGLFGTVEDCLDRVEQLKRIGVDEVACLIDYGINPEVVLEGLKPLATVLQRANQTEEIDPEDFSIAAQIMRHKVTHLQSTPSMARMFAMNEDAGHALRRLDQMLIGGEALPGALVGDLQMLTKASIENMYGPTETTIWSSSETAETGEGLVNIGRPIANTQMYVLDEDRNPLPVGSVGELYIGGDGVARGYWQRADLTAERFVDNPFIEGTKIYRTGDLVRWRPDGKIDFLGRNDHQIKLRGYRIEIGEIEARLEAIAGIEQAVVIAREDSPGDVRLVAYLKGGAGLDDKALNAALLANLPDFMVPAHYVYLDQFPLTPNKKIDRKALPAPQRKKAASGGHIAPAGGREAQIAAIWTHILGVEAIGTKDNFFDLGGHSLLAVQAHREISQAFDLKKLNVTDIFRFPVLADLSKRIASLMGEGAENAADQAEKNQAKAQARQDAMSKRRAMRAARRGGKG
ncbi:MAG: peptide synthetase [Rhodobacterales bacterium]|nr:MAG: peptide synthetase [Rhodobacterales bacterium]